MAYIFLDESGDLGFNWKKKNSKFFVITLVSVSDKRPLERLTSKIYAQLRKKVRKIGGGVLHSVKEKPITRKRFLKGISRLDCQIMTIYLDKSSVYTKLQNEKHVLYNYIVNILIDRVLSKKLTYSSGKLFLIASRRETNKFLNLNFKQYLKRQVENKHKVQIEIEIKNTAEEKALQAVDFVSWAIFRRYEFKDLEYYKIIKRKIVEENKLYK